MPLWNRILLGVSLVLGNLPMLQAQDAPVVLAGATQFALTSQHTGQRYQIYLSVPQTPAPASGFPVIYALDGDFSFPVWHQLNPRQPETFARLAQHSPTPPTPGVVVAIGYGRDFNHTQELRGRDYTIKVDCPECERIPREHGGAAQFARFIEEELRPAVAQRVPVDAARQSLFGHSFGGLFVLQQFWLRPDSFQNYFAISPSIWFGQRALLNLPRQSMTRGNSRFLALWVGADEQAIRPGQNPQRQARLQAARMVDNVLDLERLLRDERGLLTDLRVVLAHDHGEMHTFAIERALTIAFTPPWQPAP